MKRVSTLEHEEAQQLIQAAVDWAQARNLAISVSVVDALGVLLAQLRMSQAGPHTLVGSGKKAFTACSQRRSTLVIAQGMKTGEIPPTLLSLDERLTALPGGIPLLWEDQVVGAIGVGGAHGLLDHEAAEAAIASWEAGLS